MRIGSSKLARQVSRVDRTHLSQLVEPAEFMFELGAPMFAILHRLREGGEAPARDDRFRQPLEFRSDLGQLALDFGPATLLRGPEGRLWAKVFSLAACARPRSGRYARFPETPRK